MSEYIWLSHSLTDVSNWRALTSDLAERDREFAIKAGERNDAGESLGPEYFPTVIWPAENAKKSDTSAAADFFYAGTHWIVSGRFAELLRQFEMGGAHLYPVKFLQSDRQTPVKGEWFCLNFGNQKTALLPDESQGLFKPSRRKEVWVPSGPTDFEFAFSGRAVGGAAVWMDPTLMHIVCFSAELGDAMRELDITRGFKGLGDMVKGRVV
ncbi:MAG: hypothetical protein WBA51_01705 [Erythrobacter sp.]